MEYDVHRADENDGRPLKRARVEDVLPAKATRPRVRGKSACQTCRARRTKCDGRRPLCGYCSTAKADCIYPDDDDFSHADSQRLLDAMQNLTQLLTARTNSLEQISSIERPEPDRGNRRSPAQHSLQPHQLFGPPSHTNYVDQGLQSVLRWQSVASKASFDVTPTSEARPARLAHALPDLTFASLMLSYDAYIESIHSRNPFLDLHKLRRLISETSENGIEWSCSTCLVALVCALGSSARDVGSSNMKYAARTRDDSGYSAISSSEKALQFWSIAAKRLAIAIETDSIEAVQCLCLAGICYMQELQPLRAWKYFNLAANAWYMVRLQREHAEHHQSEPQSALLEQALVFTIYKFETGIKVELALPGSIVGDDDRAMDFPGLPAVAMQAAHDDEEVHRWWCFYLAEIAARHMINRILIKRKETQGLYSDRPLKRIFEMLGTSSLLQSQLDEWYQSLPDCIRFRYPDGSTSLESHELKQILQNRFLEIAELCHRPLIEFCLDTELDETIPGELVLRVTEKANRGLQYCLWRLKSASSHHSYETWFILRMVPTCASILSIVDAAQQAPVESVQPILACKLTVPAAWRREAIRVGQELGLYPLSQHRRTRGCSAVLYWAVSRA